MLSFHLNIPSVHLSSYKVSHFLDFIRAGETSTPKKCTGLVNGLVYLLAVTLRVHTSAFCGFECAAGHSNTSSE